MAKNFATEGMNILEPKIDRRDGTNGTTGSHFPLYEWLLGALIKMFGDFDFVSRIFSLVIFSFGMMAFYKVLIQLHFSEFHSTIGALLLLSIPEFYYHSINAMPDILAITLSFWSLYFWKKYFEFNQNNAFFIAVLLGVLGALIKFQFVIIPLASTALALLQRKKWINVAIAWVFIFSVVVLWYLYALQLTKLNNLKEYGLWIKPIPIQEKLNTVWLNLSMDLPEVLLGWPLFIMFLITTFKVKVHKTPLFYMSLIWAVSFAFFYIVAIERMKNHSYYLMAILPLVIVIILKFAQQKQIKNSYLLALLMLNFSWAFLRIIPSKWTESKAQIPMEFSNKELRAQFADVIPKGQQVLVGPDISGCIYFYFTKTNGFSFSKPTELLEVHNNEVKLDAIKKANVHYILFNQRDIMQPYIAKLGLKKKLKQLGSFEIWEF